MKSLMSVVALLASAAVATAGPVVVATSNATTLVNAIVGPGITVVGTPTYTGSANQSGTFTNGGNLGFASGIVLTTGNATAISGSNGSGVETLGGNINNGQFSAADNLSVDLGAPGSSGDLVELFFQFQFGDGSAGGDLFFKYVFASEEFLNYVGSQFNDTFQLLLDGKNIALLGNGLNVSVNNVNPSSNPSQYVNNVNNTNGIPNLQIDIKFDGLTVVLTAKALGLAPGVHTMKFLLADVGDGLLDSGVFIQAGTFNNQDTPNVPEPATLALTALGLAAALAFRRRR